MKFTIEEIEREKPALPLKDTFLGLSCARLKHLVGKVWRYWERLSLKEEIAVIVFLLSCLITVSFGISVWDANQQKYQVEEAKHVSQQFHHNYRNRLSTLKSVEEFIYKKEISRSFDSFTEFLILIEAIADNWKSGVIDKIEKDNTRGRFYIVGNAPIYDSILELESLINHHFWQVDFEVKAFEQRFIFKMELTPPVISEIFL